jgi:hypothetical protein
LLLIQKILPMSLRYRILFTPFYQGQGKIGLTAKK